MQLKEILSGIEGLKAKGELEQEVLKVESDSRKVENGTLFIAIRGFETDGHNYIQSAIENGASAIMVQQDFDLKSIKIV